MKRPIIYILIYFIFGLILGQCLDDKIAIILFITIVLISEIILMKINSLKMIFFFTMIFILGLFLSFNIGIPKNKEIEKLVYANKEIEILGVIKDLYISKNGYNIINLETNKIMDNKKEFDDNLNISIVSENNLNLKVGMTINIKGKLKKGKDANFKGMFSEKNYMIAKNIDYNIFVKEYDINIVSKNIKKDFNYYIYNFRDIVNKQIDKLLPLREAGIIKAMITGEKRYIDDYYKEIFKRGGISHILAISGLHISIISGFIFMVFNNYLKLSKKISSILIIPFILLFMIFCGLSPSVVRASIMTIVVLFGNIINQESDMLNSVGISGFLILLFSPESIYDIGFQFSFAAVIGISFSIEFSENFDNINNFIKNFVFISMGAYIMTLPLCMYYFYGVSISSILLNILVIPICGIIIIISLVSVLMSLIFKELGIFLIGSVFLLIQIIKFFVEFINRIDFMYIETGNINLISIIFFYLIFIWYYLFMKRTKYLKYFSVVFALAFSFSININNIFKINEITFIDTNGNSAIYRTYDGFTAVIDAGGDFKDFGKSTGHNDIIPYLNYKGIKSIDLLFFSNMNISNAKGGIELLKDFEVKNIVIPKYDIARSGIYMKLIELANKKDIKIYEVSNGDIIKISEDINFEILYPFDNNQIYLGNENHSSIVMKLNDRNNKILFTGNIELEDQYMLLNENMKSNIFKIPNDILDENFVKNILSDNVCAIYVSDEKENIPYKIKNLLEKYNIKYYNTSVNSHINVYLYKNYYNIRPLIEME